jgi:gamma-glutamylcyclotransferase
MTAQHLMKSTGAMSIQRQLPDKPREARLVRVKVVMLQTMARSAIETFGHKSSMKFFLYGDHLNPTQLKRRAPEHQFLMLATLPEHTIKFCRWSSQWRCGLASVIPSPGEQVWGAIFELTEEDLKLMDRFEEDVPPSAFRQVQVTVISEAGEKIPVTTYAATPIGKFKPKAHYLDWVMKGLKHWKLPEEAVETWKSYSPQ